jgi:hypothetical protein
MRYKISTSIADWPPLHKIYTVRDTQRNTDVMAFDELTNDWAKTEADALCRKLNEGK